MPRPKNIKPAEKIAFYATQENAARLLLATHSVIAGRARYGAVSQIINEALNDYFHKGDFSCIPAKPNLDSPSSKPSPSSET